MVCLRNICINTLHNVDNDDDDDDDKFQLSLVLYCSLYSRTNGSKNRGIGQSASLVSATGEKLYPAFCNNEATVLQAKFAMPYNVGRVSYALEN